MIAQVALLRGAARRVGFRVEVDEELPAPVVLQSNRLAVLIEEREVWRGVALLECRHGTTVRRCELSLPADSGRRRPSIHSGRS